MISNITNNYDVNFMYNQAAPQRTQQPPLPQKEQHHPDKSKQIAQKTSAIASGIMLLGVIAYYLKSGEFASKPNLTQVHAGHNLSLIG